MTGHESRHALERKYAGNDHNYSTPDMAMETNPTLAVGCRESGYGFELAAVGGKLSFGISYFCSELQNAMLDEIKTSFNTGKAPALDKEQLARFAHFSREPNSEMAFDYDFGGQGRYQGRYFT